MIVTRVMPTEASQRALWDRCMTAGKGGEASLKRGEEIECLNTVLKIATRINDIEQRGDEIYIGE